MGLSGRFHHQLDQFRHYFISGSRWRSSCAHGQGLQSICAWRRVRHWLRAWLSHRILCRDASNQLIWHKQIPPMGRQCNGAFRSADHLRIQPHSGAPYGFCWTDSRCNEVPTYQIYMGCNNGKHPEDGYSNSPVLDIVGVSGRLDWELGGVIIAAFAPLTHQKLKSYYRVIFKVTDSHKRTCVGEHPELGRKESFNA